MCVFEVPKEGTIEDVRLAGVSLIENGALDQGLEQGAGIAVGEVMGYGARPVIVSNTKRC